MSRSVVLTDAQWARIEPLMPSSDGHARLVAQADAHGGVDWSISVDSTVNPRPPARHQRRQSRGPHRGVDSSYTNLRGEPPDHAIGRSRGGLSTKIHQLVDSHGRPLVVALTAGQAGDSPMLNLLANLAVARDGPGRPRTRPAALLGDKAYSSRANRQLLRAKRVKTVIAQPCDQISHRKRRGSTGGRPPAFDTEAYKGRNVVERSFNDHKQWRGLATRYDKLAAVYRGGVVLRAITIWLRQ